MISISPCDPNHKGYELTFLSRNSGRSIRPIQPPQSVAQVGIRRELESKPAAGLHMGRVYADVRIESASQGQRWILKLEREGIRRFDASCARQQRENLFLSIESRKSEERAG